MAPPPQQKNNRQDTAAIDAALAGLGVVTSRDDTAARREMAYGMFDTRGRVDPFSPDSPIKKTAIERFPPDLFFVLRVVQLLRGIAQGGSGGAYREGRGALGERGLDRGWKSDVGLGRCPCA